MPGFNSLWQKNVFKRLVLSFVCILLPLFLLYWVFYLRSMSAIRKNISDEVQSQVSFYVNGLETDIERIKTLQYDCFTDGALNELSVIPQALTNIQCMDDILSLQQRLNSIKNSSIYIKEVFVEIPALKRRISSENVSEFDQAEFNFLCRIPLHPDAQIIYSGNKLLLSAAYPVSYRLNRKAPVFVIGIELSSARIREALLYMTKDRGDEVILANPRAGFHIQARQDKRFDLQTADLLKLRLPIQKNYETVHIEKDKYMAFYVESKFLGSILCKYVREASIFEPLKAYRIWFAVFAAVALVIIALYSAYVHRFIHKPLSRLVEAFKKVENGELKVSIEYMYDDEFRFIYKHFNKMVQNLGHLIDQNYKQKLLMQKSEMKQLQAQINPHFLYNSFFTLSTMARLGDYENLEFFTEQLGEYFQFITRNAAQEVTLAQEVSHARIYVQIQQLRFSKRIHTEVDPVPDEICGIMVPKLILQPIVENCFVHGLEKKSHGGLMRVGFKTCDTGFSIVVEDNGSGADRDKLARLQEALDNSSEEEETTGLINIHKRIRLRFGQESGIAIRQSELGGVCVSLTIRLGGDVEHVSVINC